MIFRHKGEGADALPRDRTNLVVVVCPLALCLGWPFLTPQHPSVRDADLRYHIFSFVTNSRMPSLQGLEKAFEFAGKEVPTCKYHLINRIPFARGYVDVFAYCMRTLYASFSCATTMIYIVATKLQWCERSYMHNFPDSLKVFFNITPGWAAARLRLLRASAQGLCWPSAR